MVVLETNRLILREFDGQDAKALYLLNLDPDVIKFTGDKAFNDIEEASVFIKNYRQYQEYGFGRWAAINKETNEFIGWCGLKYSKELKEHDLGFRFFKRNWNKGYATEAAKACIKFGFNTFKIKQILGRAMKENQSSIKVLIKSGMQFSHNYEFDSKPGVIYKADNSFI